jgi:phosphoribosylaminoimidazolecarboxamide formyltransferase/IMP cyclohydrolase
MSAPRRAILSVYDKQDLRILAEALVIAGWELIASGGTFARIQEVGLPVRAVSDVTGAPEMIGGRVKTLHPAIHGGILAQPTESDLAEIAGYGIQAIDMVVCNLYPFQRTIATPGITLAEAVEDIDIGGVALLRAAAKNFARVAVVCDPADYPALIAAVREGEIPLELRKRLAVTAFTHTRDYDAAITAYLNDQFREYI